MDDHDGPVDPSAVQADSQLLDEIGRGQWPSRLHAPDPADAPLIETLVGWRQVIDAEPIPEIVAVDAAQVAIQAGRRSGRGGRRVWRKWVRNFLRWRR